MKKQITCIAIMISCSLIQSSELPAFQDDETPRTITFKEMKYRSKINQTKNAATYNVKDMEPSLNEMKFKSNKRERNKTFYPLLAQEEHDELKDLRLSNDEPIQESCLLSQQAALNEESAFKEEFDNNNSQRDCSLANQSAIIKKAKQANLSLQEKRNEFKNISSKPGQQKITPINKAKSANPIKSKSPARQNNQQTRGNSLPKNNSTSRPAKKNEKHDYLDDIEIIERCGCSIIDCLLT